MAAAAVLLTLAAASSLTVSSCRGNSGGTDTFIPAVPDWSDAAAWYISQPSGDNAPAADIFYILPTCIWDWTAADGQTCRYSDYTRTDHIAFLPSVELAEDIFAQGQYGFYCPYYRQISLNVWMDGEAAVEELFPLSMEDVSAAFDYYLDNYNEGRPFVLAGFSQGGKAVVELVKHLPAPAYKRMVAAYAIGYRVSDEELAQYPQLRPAVDSTGTGTIICYNSVATPEAACAVLSPSDICINRAQRLGDRHRRHGPPPADSGRPRPGAVLDALARPNVLQGQLPPAGTHPIPGPPEAQHCPPHP